jgi:hypothetical protein
MEDTNNVDGLILDLVYDDVRQRRKQKLTGPRFFAWLSTMRETSKLKEGPKQARPFEG